MHTNVDIRGRITLALALVLALASGVAAQPDAYLPDARVAEPYALIDQNEPRTITHTPVFRIYGDDPDGELAAFRWIVLPALLPSGNYAVSRLAVEEAIDDLVPFTHADWSAWQTWPAGEPYARIELPMLPEFDAQSRRVHYLFAVQVMDDAGAVQITRTYGHNVAHFRVGDLAPVLAIFEARLGDDQAIGPDILREVDLAPGTFEWIFAASGEAYGGEITGLRWGFDLIDPDDPDDPGWHGPASPVLHTTGPVTIASGIHNLVIEATDHAGGVTRLIYWLSVVQPPPPEDQLPLLLVDDVIDRNSNAWTGPPPASVAYDRDTYRDAFWQEALTGGGGVVNFDPVRDVVDAEVDPIDLRKLMSYRAVVWTTRLSLQSTVARELRPAWDPWRELMRHNWLADYQRSGGNVLLAGSHATHAFHMDATYALPVVYESTEGDPNGFIQDSQLSYRVGFGRRTLPDDSTLPRHQLQYGYRDLGLSVIDQMSPNTADVIYGSEPLISARNGRKSVCAAMKGLILDDAFASAHAPAIADAIPTEDLIDWRDLDPAYYDNLLNVYQWGDDEFYENAGDRPTPYTEQTCEDGPDGKCIEPMFRSVARFDWIRAQHLAADPEDTWPEGYYSVPMSQLCGAYALANLDTAKTNDQVVGFLSYQTIDAKPNGRADVVWGFDPYRLDHGAMTEAIRWVLGEHFGLTMLP
jgi:RimJ/RimL family protein N-acetyltransferase